MTTDTHINPRSSLGALVVERPARAELFDRLRLDYCCGGRQALADACAERGLDPNTASAALAALDAEAVQRTSVEDTDWRQVGTAELCAHIVAVHHDGLREAFPRLEQLLDTVVRVHGDSEPRLGDAQRLFREIRAELEPHLASEEAELFPACIAREQHGAPIDDGILDQHEREHAAVGDALAGLRRLCHDYDRENALCNTHRVLLDALEAFEQDLHRHVHEENNILMPRARQEAVAANAEPRPSASPRQTTAVEPTPALPQCCEGWIAEQTHGWAAHRRGR